MNKCVAWVVVLLAIVSTSVVETAAQGDLSSEPWERIQDPVEVGFSREGLDRVDAYARSLNSHGIVVIVGGRLLFEYGDIEEVSYVASVRKSILSMLYGNYVAEGAIDLDLTLEDLEIDDVDGLLPIEKRATVEDLLTVRSGVFHAASNPGGYLEYAPPRGSQEPGTYMLYANWDFNAAGTIFEQLTGKNIFDAVSTDLAQPLGLQDWNRDRHQKSGDASQSVHLAYHMWFSTRDMARLGELMLREGLWKGEQVIPSDWVKRTVSVFTPSEEMNPSELRGGEFGYGHMWWVWDGPLVPCAFEGAYSANGAYGQYITIIPKLDMVVAHKTVPPRRTSRTHYAGILNRLVAAKITPVCSDPSRPQALDATVHRLEVNLPESVLQTYVGVYQFESGLLITVTVEEGTLWAQATGQDRHQMFAEWEGEFFLKDVDLQASFTKDESGKVVGLVTRKNGRSYVGTRVRN